MSDIGSNTRSNNFLNLNESQEAADLHFSELNMSTPTFKKRDLKFNQKELLKLQYEEFK